MLKLFSYCSDSNESTSYSSLQSKKYSVIFIQTSYLWTLCLSGGFLTHRKTWTRVAKTACLINTSSSLSWQSDQKCITRHVRDFSVKQSYYLLSATGFFQFFFQMCSIKKGRLLESHYNQKLLVFCYLLYIHKSNPQNPQEEHNYFLANS